MEKNVFSKAWKRILEHQYQLYLTRMRVQRDSEGLKQELSNIRSQKKLAEAENVDLRKQIRNLELELSLIYQRNAHDSCVIDGLQEVNFKVGEVGHLTADKNHKLTMATLGNDHENHLINMLQEETSLLRRRDGEDAALIQLLKPLEAKLKIILDDEKMKNHQQSMKFKRELEEIIKQFQQKISRVQEIKNEKSSEMLWANSTFSSMFGREMPEEESLNSDDRSVGSSVETDQFNVSSEGSSNMADMENSEPMKLDHSEYVAKKELLDSKNLICLHMIHDCYSSLMQCMDCLVKEHLSLYDVSADVAFLKEYVERLDTMRKKRDVVTIGDTTIEEAQRLDQKGLILTSLLTEKDLIEKILDYFLSNLKDDFEACSVTLRSMEDIYKKS